MLCALAGAERHLMVKRKSKSERQAKQPPPAPRVKKEKRALVNDATVFHVSTDSIRRMTEDELRWQIQHALGEWQSLGDQGPTIVLMFEQELHRRGLMVSEAPP